MDILLWGIIYFISALSVFGFGYLFAAREFGKDVKFYKDCLKNWRGKDLEAQAELRKVREERLEKDEALIAYLNERIDVQEAKIAASTGGTLDNAFKRGEQYGYWAVLLHLQGRI